MAWSFNVNKRKAPLISKFDLTSLPSDALRMLAGSWPATDEMGAGVPGPMERRLYGCEDPYMVSDGGRKATSERKAYHTRKSGRSEHPDGHAIANS